jgi:hypothetical protein
MRKILTGAGLATALMFGSTSVALAQAPDLSGYTTLDRRFFATTGSTSFTVEFLYGFASNDNTLLFQVGGVGPWTKIFTTSGQIPSQTTTPSLGSTFTFNFGAALLDHTEITFALCQGSVMGPTLAGCGVGGAQGPFLSGLNAPQYRSLTRAEWNTNRGALNGVDATFATVFGVEDIDIARTTPPISDIDFNDQVFATNLTTTVPEPSTVVLMSAGLLAVAGFAARRKRLS